MGRKRKETFVEQKMLASRVEKSDYLKFEEMTKYTGKTLQQIMNLFVTSYISGNVVLDGDKFVSNEKESQDV